MSFPDDFASLIQPLKALQRLLDQYGEGGVIIGGIATGFLGRPRFTAVRLPTPEDLVILKAVAHRQKDLLDIREIVLNNPNLDLSRIERWIKDFSELLETPELWGQIEKILKQQE